MKLLAFVFLLATVAARAEVKVTPGDITDARSTGKFINKSLTVELKLSGPEIVECKAMRVALKQATDDTGNVLKEQNRIFEGEFEDSHSHSMGNLYQDPKDTLRAELELENPARSAKTISFEGSVELLVPSKDPAAVISVGVAKAAGQPVQNAALKAAGITLTFKASKDSDAGYSLADPQKKVAAVEFCSAGGEPLKTTSHMKSNFGGKEEVSIHLEGPAPAGMTAKVYLVTDKSLIRVPVKLPAVGLP